LQFYDFLRASFTKLISLFLFSFSIVPYKDNLRRNQFF
jgi:hypothetical protein